MIRIMTTKNEFLINRSILKTQWNSQVINIQFVARQKLFKKMFHFCRSQSNRLFLPGLKMALMQKSVYIQNLILKFFFLIVFNTVFYMLKLLKYVYFEVIE